MIKGKEESMSTETFQSYSLPLRLVPCLLMTEGMAFLIPSTVGLHVLLLMHPFYTNSSSLIEYFGVLELLKWIALRRSSIPWSG